MSQRAISYAAMAILGFALLGAQLFAPSVFSAGAVAMGTGVMLGATTGIETGLTFQSLEAAR